MKSWLVLHKKVVLTGLLVILIACAALLIMVTWPALSSTEEEEVLTSPSRAQAARHGSANDDAPLRKIVSPSLPLTLSKFEKQSEYRLFETLETWRALSSESCADYALAILEEIHAQDLEVLQAGFMDVSGESWSCVLTGSEGESLTIVLLPERPFSPRSEENLLVVNVMHYFVPEGLS